MIVRMPKFSTISFLLLFAATAWAGEAMRPAAGPRQEFRQRKTYPYVFEPVPYLENGAPPPLRFGELSSDHAKHNPPALPEAAKPKAEPTPKPLPQPKAEPTPEPKPQPTPEPSPKPSSEEANKPLFPPPENAQPVPPPDSLDMTKYPAEVVDIFKNPYNAPSSRKRFFDPVFEPAQTQKAPASKATYREE